MAGVQLGTEAARLDGADQIGLGDFSVEKHCAADDLANVGAANIRGDVRGDRGGVDPAHTASGTITSSGPPADCPR